MIRTLRWSATRRVTALGTNTQADHIARIMRCFTPGTPTSGSLTPEVRSANLEDQSMVLHKQLNTNLTMLEGDIETFLKKIAPKCTGDLMAFYENRKQFGTVSQVLYDEDRFVKKSTTKALDDISGLYGPDSVIEFDFTLLKPIQIQDQKLRPRKNQLLIESSSSQTKNLLAILMQTAGGLQATRQYQVHDLTDEIYSYRLFQSLKFYEGSPDTRGRLFKQLYPAQEDRPQSTEEDDFMDLMILNPRSPKLWINIYSPDPDLWSSMGVPKAPEHHYDLTRWMTSLPEFLECEGTTLKTCNLYRLDLLKKNENDVLAEAIANKRRKLAALGKLKQANEPEPNSSFKIGILSDSASEVYGQTIGLNLSDFLPHAKIDANLVIENPDGSRPIRVVKSAGNALLLEVADTCTQRMVEVQGKHLHIYDIQGIWADEQ